MARFKEDMAAYLQEVAKLPEILEQIEDLKAARLPQATPHRAIDRAGIRIDYRFAIRHFFDGAASTSSGINTPSTPSFQVSALETSSSELISEYHTAPMSQISNGECCQPSRKCIRILVRNLEAHQTMIFQVDPKDTIGKIKSLVRERIGLEHPSFELLYSSRTLKSSDMLIDEHEIPYDATLTCFSFGPNIASGRMCTQILVRNVGVHQTIVFQADLKDTIEKIKSLVRERIGLDHVSFELLYLTVF